MALLSRVDVAAPTGVAAAEINPRPSLLADELLLVDDHSLVRRGFRRMLEDDAEIEVAWAKPATAMTPSRQAARLRPP
jgi:hypothetical protein